MNRARTVVGVAVAVASAVALAGCAGTSTTLKDGTKIESDGSAVKVTASDGTMATSHGSTVAVTSTDGDSMVVDGADGKGAKVPADLPADIALPKGTLKTGTKMTTGGDQMWVLVYIIDGSVKDALAQEVAALKGKGFNALMETGTSAMLAKGKLTVTIGSAAAQNLTVTVMQE